MTSTVSIDGEQADWEQTANNFWNNNDFWNQPLTTTGLSGRASIMPFPPTLFAQNPQNSFSSNPSAWRNPHSQHSITHPNQPHYIPVALLAENYSSPQLMNSYNNTHSLIQNSPLVNNVNIPILPTAPDFAQIHRAILVPKAFLQKLAHILCRPLYLFHKQVMERYHLHHKLLIPTNILHQEVLEKLYLAWIIYTTQ